MAGIAAVGLYVPRYSISADEFRKALGRFAAVDVEEKSVPGFDEDEVTMAVEAGQRALAAEGAKSVDRLAFVSAGTLTGSRIVAEALGIDADSGRDVLGNAVAGETIVADAIAEASKGGTSTLVVASDAPRTGPTAAEEDAGGAAAVAVLVTAKAMQAWSRGAARSPLLRRIGDAGAASGFVSFLETITATEVKGTSEMAKALEGRSPVSYERYIAMRHDKPVPAGTEYSQGAYVSMPAYLGETKARYRLVGEECAKCGRLHFPPRESCLACGAHAWRERRLRRTGTVYAFTIIGRGAAPSEFLGQQLATGDYATAVVELDDGLRITAMLADVNPGDVRIGMSVRMVFRWIYVQEGVVRYGFKFAPG